MEPASTNIRQTIIQDFQFFKQTQRLDQLWAKAIAFADESGFLLPVSELQIQDSLFLEKLDKWQKEYTHLTQEPEFQKEDLNTPEQSLFLMVDQNGHSHGYIGLFLSQDSLLSVNHLIVDSLHSSVFKTAMSTLVPWVLNSFPKASLQIELSKNTPQAMELFKAHSFHPVKEDVSVITLKYQESEAVDPQKMILTAGPFISAREPAYALDAAKYGWNHQWSKYLKEFEKSFCDYIGVKHALPTSCCTGALHLSLLALDIGPGDEVIVPDITWVATANAVSYVGATPVFADIDPQTWCLDPASFESKITDRTKAVMPVHLYGHPAEMDQIMAIARKHSLYVVEDAAPSIGAKFKGQFTGTFGDFAGFSFQGAKLLVSGEGGMLVTNNTELYEKVYTLWDQGRKPGTFWIHKQGWKYKMSNVQAAIGLGQLERADAHIAAKRKLFAWYKEGLEGAKFVRLMEESVDVESIYWMCNLEVLENAPISRDELCAKLKEMNVDTRNVFPAISQYPIWDREQTPQPNALHAGLHGVNLPSGVCLTKAQVMRVCECIQQILA